MKEITITWRELKELVEREAMGRDVEDFEVVLTECLDGTAPTRVEVLSLDSMWNNGAPTIRLGI